MHTCPYIKSLYEEICDFRVVFMTRSTVLYGWVTLVKHIILELSGLRELRHRPAKSHESLQRPEANPWKFASARMVHVLAGASGESCETAGCGLAVLTACARARVGKAADAAPRTKARSMNKSFSFCLGRGSGDHFLKLAWERPVWSNKTSSPLPRTRDTYMHMQERVEGGLRLGNMQSHLHTSLSLYIYLSPSLSLYIHVYIYM